MIDRLRKLLMYGMLEPEQFSQVKPQVDNENSFSLKLASIVQILYYGASFIGSLGLADLANKRLVYGLGTVIPFIVLVLHLLFSKKHPDLQTWLVRGFCVGLYATALLCTLVCTPAEMTILLLIFFFCVPMVFIVRPIELVLLALVTDIIYFAAAPALKAPGVLSMDMIDMGIFSTLSVILGVSHLRERYRRYWLETEAVDLAKVRYQAAFFDQLTGAYNRNAYNKDLEDIAKKPTPDDFMFIMLDLNGLKAANDSMGHVAGDELIIGAADCLMKSFSEYGKVYRIGGDEFAVMLNTKGTSEGQLLENFNRRVDAWHGSLVQKLSVSYGVVMANEAKPMTVHETELLADKRMYQSKSDYYKNAGIDRRKH